MGILRRKRKLPPDRIDAGFRIIAQAYRYGIGDQDGPYFWLGFDAEGVRK